MIVSLGYFCVGVILAFWAVGCQVWAVVNAILACFVLISLCWVVLRIGIWSTRLLPAMKTSRGG